MVSQETLFWSLNRRQSEFRELALTGRYFSVHLASAQFARGYEHIDSPYSTYYGSDAS